MTITTVCKKCGVTVRLDFGEMTKEQAEEACKKMDSIPRECPGRHVELGGFWEMWDLENAIHRAFDLGQGEESKPVPTDKEYVDALRKDGKDVWDGGCKTVPEFELRGIHEIPDLRHLGFGEFCNDAYRFLRCDSPRGTRFYERVARA